MKQLKSFRLFDSHFHIIDSRFPLIPNQGYLPEEFTVCDYQQRTKGYQLIGGAVVSGSFQAFDQSYLLDALAELGPGFVGVTQLPATVSDAELLQLDDAGVRAIRFNLKRGGSAGLKDLEPLAQRVYETVGWHVELYIDSKDLPSLKEKLLHLPAVCIDHLGLSAGGFPTLLELIERGIFVKATGFGRVDFPVCDALKQIVAVNPDAMVFGTDLPSTRAPRPYLDDDFRLITEMFSAEIVQKLLCDNGLKLYRQEILHNDDNS